jgi:hypothetical protein
MLRVYVPVLVGGRRLPMVVVLLVLKYQAVLVLRLLLLPVRLDKELFVPFLGVLLKLLVLFGDRLHGCSWAEGCN